jgi:hypothetical protein
MIHRLRTQSLLLIGYKTLYAHNTQQYECSPRVCCAYQIDAHLRVDKAHLELFEPRGYSVCIVQIREVNRRGQCETWVSKANLLANSKVMCIHLRHRLNGLCQSSAPSQFCL